MVSRLEIHELSPPELAGEAALRAASPQGTPFAGAAWMELLAEQLPGRLGALAVTAGPDCRSVCPIVVYASGSHSRSGISGESIAQKWCLPPSTDSTGCRRE